MKSIEIVATPGSGEGRALGTARLVHSALVERGYRARVRCFASYGDLRRWAHHGAPTFTHVVCVGGDATQSAAAEAAIRAHAPLVPVPSGFGNVFARTFGIGDGPQDIADLVERGAKCQVDVGQGEGEAFLCHRSYGFLADVQSAVERSRAQPRSRLRRHLAYYTMALEILRDIPLSSIRVDIDGEPVAEDCALVTIANVETYRGFLTLTPAASPFDGLFDVCLLRHRSKRRLFASLLGLLLKLPHRWDGVQLWRGSQVSVSVDGRACEQSRVLPGVLTVLVSRERLRKLSPARALVPSARRLPAAA